jgi:predicted kinase
MEMIVFIGIPGSGKSTFYKRNFFNTHLRVNLDMLRTRQREEKLINFCFKTSMPLVIDNTNVSVLERRRYIKLAKLFEYKIKGYYFKADVKKCLDRNSQREGRGKVSRMAILSKFKALEEPEYVEGFDELFLVESFEESHFKINKQKEGTIARL